MLGSICRAQHSWLWHQPPPEGLAVPSQPASHGGAIQTHASCHPSPPIIVSAGSGDWALYPSAALYFEGTENVTVQGCTLRELGGNALMMRGYNRWCACGASANPPHSAAAGASLRL